MRKIEKEMIEAIKAKKSYSNDNTRVVICEDDTTIKVELHNYEIAVITSNELHISDAGFQTKTTKSRLNCLLNHFDLPIIYSKNFQWYIGSNTWLGDTGFLINQPNTPQPKEYDVVLGGKEAQPRPYDAVLGGKK